MQAPRAFMRGLRAFCDAHGALLIADEVRRSSSTLLATHY